MVEADRRETLHRRLITAGFYAVYLAGMGALMVISTPLAEGWRAEILYVLGVAGLAGAGCIATAKLMRF